MHIATINLQEALIANLLGHLKKCYRRCGPIVEGLELRQVLPD